jgi:UDP:flavonoid glycosyltransferase YjiC (YdhE family)
MKILFKIYPQKSHLNATFPLAKELRRLGHEIVYAGIRELEGHVTAQGFAYHVQAVDVFPYVEYQQAETKVTLWRTFGWWWKNRRWAAARRSHFGASDPFGPLLAAVRPDAVLVDSPYTLFALSLFRHRLPFGMVESMMNLSRAADSTPFDTTYVPRGGWRGRVAMGWHWRRYFVKRWILGALGFRADYSRRFVLECARAAGVDAASLDFERYFHLGLTDVPEFILSPEPLDFPRMPAPNQVYVGPSVLVDRVETSGDYLFDAEFVRLAEERKRGRPLVYCSLGTAGWRYHRAERFLHRVIAAAAGQRWNLLVAVGSRFRLQQFAGPANVVVFQTVPQLRVLRAADLMITHGGMNSIAECALLGVPMLVCPGTKQIDQAGNAARIVYHRLGLQGTMTTEKPSALARKIETILLDPQYRERTSAMGRRIANSDAWTKGAERVIEALESTRSHGFKTGSARPAV